METGDEVINYYRRKITDKSPRFKIYVVKYDSSNKSASGDTLSLFYVGVCQERSASIISYLKREYRASGKNKYKTIGAILENNMDKVSTSKLNKVYDTKHEADVDCYAYQLKLQEKGLLLNDYIIDPKKEICEGCGCYVRVQLMESHKNGKCSAVINEDFMSVLGE